MASTTSDDEDIKGVLEIAKDKLLHPLHVAFSKPARRAYIQTALLLLGSCALFGLAVTAYSLFYYAYVPTRGFAVPVHLQFDHHNPARRGADAHAALYHHPFGVAAGLRPLLATDQAYDVRVELTLPRTPDNVAAGNFMLELRLLESAPPPTAPSSASAAGGVGALPKVLSDAIAGETIAGGREEEEVPQPATLARSRRPGILTWRSRAVEHAHQAVALPWFLLGWRREAETLAVRMMEGVRFPKGRGGRAAALPDALRLELAATERMQVYDVQVLFEAKLAGLRYVMYNWRLAAAAVFITAFWLVEMTFMVLAWLALSNVLAGPLPPAAKQEPKAEEESFIKTEDGETEEGTDVPDLSDTPRTFPSYGSQPALRYSSPRVKSEEDDEGAAAGPADVPPAATTGQEGDDEDEDADFILDTDGRHLDRDSGLGTSMESGQERRESVRRRRSGGLFGSGSRNG